MKLRAIALIGIATFPLWDAPGALGKEQADVPTIFTPADTTHSFQFSIGFGMRF